MSKRPQYSRDVRVLIFQSKTNKEGLIARLQSEPCTNEAVCLERDTKAYAPFDDFCKRNTELLENIGEVGKDVGQDDDDHPHPMTKHNEARENRLLQQHRATWAFDWSKMEREADNVAAELSDILVGWQDEENELSEIAECQRNVVLDEDEFVEKTIKPVLTLRDDVIFWLSAFEMQENYGQGDSNDVLSLIASVKQQQKKVLEQLTQELQKVETFQRNSAEKNNLCSLQGVPPSLSMDLCPTEDFRNEFVEEFLLLDVKFQQKLTAVQERFLDIIRAPNDGWTAEDHNLFVHGSTFYSTIFPHYQELTYDYLLRLLPHYSLDDLLKHSYWVTRQRQYHRTISATLSDWQRCKEELLSKVNSAISAACRQLQEQNEKVVTQASQRAVCEKLSEKVVQWRKERFAKLQLEDAREHEAYFKLKRQQYAEELQRRGAVKAKLMQYHKELELKQQEELAMQSTKMESLLKRKEYEARYNKTRVQYREATRQMVVQQNKEQIIAKENELSRRQEKLDALRRMVAVEAVRDPLRTMQATSAYEAKRKHVFDIAEDIPLMQPLYEVYGFNDKQLSADLRVHLETKLREAGLLHLPYAQDALRQVPPPTLPRPDMKSSIKFGDS